MRSVPGAGHMVHQTATEEVMSAIDEAALMAKAPIPAAASRVTVSARAAE